MSARSCPDRFSLIALIAALVLLITAVALSLVPQPAPAQPSAAPAFSLSSTGGPTCPA